MCIREEIERREETLSGFPSSLSRGRKKGEKKDELRTCFQVDRDRIVHSKAFKRLKGKTQVFIMPKDDHFMNRLTHTLEVSQIARTIASCLNLNEALTEAIALGHDLAHSCYGHAGEEILDCLFVDGYSHETEAYRRIQYLEKRGERRGLNLTFEVIDGIVNHSGFDNNPKALTKEGQIIPFADKIAYLTSDMENAIKMGLIKDIPGFVKKDLGETKGHIIASLIEDIVRTSGESIRMSGEMFAIANEFRQFMFNQVYFSDYCRKQAEKAHRMIERLYVFLKENPQEVPSDYCDEDTERNIVDYISSMTDRFCSEKYQEYFLL